LLERGYEAVCLDSFLRHHGREIKVLEDSPNVKDTLQPVASGGGPQCRFCNSPLQHIFVDLGMSPLSNAYLKPSELARMEPFYPLVVFVCGQCFLVQLEEFESPDGIFTDYLYFSSYSESWVEHARVYTNMIVDRLKLGCSHRVVELASNDGYLLQHFVAKGIPVLGIEPAANVAEAAIKDNIPTKIEFFGESMARRLVD
jgi:hypothetical protein